MNTKVLKFWVFPLSPFDFLLLTNTAKQVTRGSRNKHPQIKQTNERPQKVRQYKPGGNVGVHSEANRAFQ